MTAVKVNFHNEQEERVLLSILESLDYDYEIQYNESAQTAIDDALKVSIADADAGRVQPHEDVMKNARARFGL